MTFLNRFFPEKEAVRFVKKTSEVRNGTRGPVRCTYEIHSASTESSARRFLRKRDVFLDQYYIVVETPTGSWVRNIDGMYREG